MIQIPTAEQIQAYLNGSGTAGLANASAELVAAQNHIIYRVVKGDRVCAVRMVNPQSYRQDEWVTMAEEYAVLKAIEKTGLGPKAYALDEGFAPPFLVQDFVQAGCYNGLKPLSEEHLVGAARAIALLNQQSVSPELFPFMRKYVHRGYQRASTTWYFRLADSFRRLPRRDVLQWAFRILSLARRASRILARSERLLPSEYSFHFDGAHTGNTYWRDGKTMFLDWQKVSWRNDPSFTIVRFATSAGEKGIMPEGVWRTLIEAYTDVRPLPDFGELAWVRLIERQVADLTWVLWDHTRRRDSRPVETATSVWARYAEVQRLLR